TQACVEQIEVVFQQHRSRCVIESGENLQALLVALQHVHGVRSGVIGMDKSVRGQSHRFRHCARIADEQAEPEVLQYAWSSGRL
nr:hypothetical protein [Tanacetum cinerariifolium]